MPKYLLLQIRNPDDPMLENEIRCFAKALGCEIGNVVPHDLIRACPTQQELDNVDAVLVGGSGDYSVATGGDWLPAAMQFFRTLYEIGKPTFASCWGFQAFARALGGVVVTDLDRAELGTFELTMTEKGQSDRLFSPLGPTFKALLGHQDIVDKLPAEAILLCSSEKVVNQAYTFKGKPIYATQFHPELELDDLIKRLVQYPEYVEKITGLKLDEFLKTCSPTPATPQLLRRFADLVVLEN